MHVPEGAWHSCRKERLPAYATHCKFCSDEYTGIMSVFQIILDHICMFLWFQALHYLVLISEVEEVEIFKICLEYWSALAANLYKENPFSSAQSLLYSNKIYQNPAMSHPSSPCTFYAPVLSKVGVLLVYYILLPELCGNLLILIFWLGRSLNALPNLIPIMYVYVNTVNSCFLYS